MTSKHRVVPLLVLVVFIGIFSSGCSVSTKTMKSPKYHVEFYKNDFAYSSQVTGEATSVRVLGIDWNRFFSWNNGVIDSDMEGTGAPGSISSISFATYDFAGAVSFVPAVIGNVLKGNTSKYALYDMMLQNPGYDVIVYPQYEMEKKGFPLIYTKTYVKVTARLAKIKK